MSEVVDFGTKAYETEIDYEYLKQIEGDSQALYKYIDDNFIMDKYRAGKPPVAKQCQAMAAVCKLLGLHPSDDQFIFVMTDYTFVNNQAVAGAGKTSFSQLRAIKEKLVSKMDGKEILCIAYNKEAERDMLARHKSLVNKYNNYYRQKIKEKFIQEIRSGKVNERELYRKYLLDDYIETYTFHSFAYNWILEYQEDFPNILKVKEKDFLITEDTAKKLMQSALELWLEDAPKEMQSKITGKTFVSLVKQLMSLYQWRAETLDFGFEEALGNQFLKDILGTLKDLQPIKEIFSYYDSLKKRRMVIDFSDILVKFLELLQQPVVLNRIRKLYKYIIFDEFQDTSNAMLRAVQLITKGDEKLGIPPADDIKLTVIGDIDQCLYTFRGVSVDNSLRFKEIFGSENTKIVSMSANRRSLAPIVEMSASIISQNVKRIKKPIVPVKGVSLLPEDDGKKFEDCDYKAVELRTYKSESEYIRKIVEELKEKSATELGETAIIYRNKSSSVLIAMELFKNGIPAIISKGIQPFMDIYSRSVLEVLDMCASPTNFVYIQKALPKVLPKFKGFSATVIRDICAKEKTLYEKDVDANKKKFWEYDFGRVATNSAFSYKMGLLKKLNDGIKTGKSVTELSKLVFSLLDVNMLRFSDDMLDDSLIPILQENFISDKPYNVFRKQLSEKLSDFRENENTMSSVKLTTFHSTKGLEYNTVYLIDLEDSIFPGKEVADCAGNTELELNALESARRLFYVAVTRARNKLVAYISANNHCRFINDIDKKFISNELQAVLNSASKVPTMVKEDIQVSENDTFKGLTSISKENYLESLNIVTISCGNTKMSGWLDNGFILAGDYMYKIKKEQEEQEKLQRINDFTNQLASTGTTYFSEEEQSASEEMSEDVDLFADEG